MDEDFRNISEQVENLGNEVDELLPELNSEYATIEQKINNINRLQAISSELDNVYNSIANSSIRENGRVQHSLEEQIAEQRKKISDLVIEESNNIIKNYLTKLEKLEKKSNDLLNSLNFDFTILKDINDEVTSLVNEYQELKGSTKEIISLINESSSNIYDLSEKELEKKLAALRLKIKVIKQKQISNYNTMVGVLNSRITALKSDLEGLEPGLVARINGLPSSVAICEIIIRNANQNSYLSQLNYENVSSLLALTAELEKSKNTRGSVATDEGAETSGTDSEGDSDTVEEVTDVEALTTQLNNLMEKIESVETLEELVELKNLINDFEVKLESVKEKITEEEYNNLMAKLTELKDKVNSVTERLTSSSREDTPEYNNFLNQLNALDNRIGYVTSILLDPAFENNKVSQNVIRAFNNSLDSIAIELGSLMNDIESRYGVENGLTDEQYDNLKRKVEEVNEKIISGNNKVSAFIVLKENGFLDLLDGNIDNLSQAIANYEELVNTADTPINHKNRKILDMQYQKLVGEVERIEKDLAAFKETDADKYEEEKQKLDQCKIKLNEVNKKYLANCPLRVRASRSAKNFYKKHKKEILVVGGLAAVALLAQPIIIPAIMHGNLLLANKIAFLRPVLVGINNTLGSAINANIVNTVINGVSAKVWQLASGLILTPTVTSTALLKGIALSVGGTAVLSAPLIGGVVMGLKKLTQKIKNKDKRNPLGEMPVLPVHTETETPSEILTRDDGAIDATDEEEIKLSKDVKFVLNKLKKMSPEKRKQVLDNSPELKELLGSSVETESIEEELTEESGRSRG